MISFIITLYTNLLCKCPFEMNTYNINIQVPQDVALCYVTRRLRPSKFNATPNMKPLIRPRMLSCKFQTTRQRHFEL